MANSMFDNALNRAGLQEQSAAANAAMIITGLEKELNTKKVKIDAKEPQISFEQLSKYVQKLVDVTQVNKINKFQKGYEEGEGSLEFFVKTGTGWFSNKKKRAFSYLKKEEERQIIKVGEVDTFAGLKNIDPKLLKEYIVYSARIFAKTPPDKQEEFKARLREIEISLAARGLSAQQIDLIQNRIKNVVKIELAELIKEKLHETLQDPQASINTILSSKSSVKLLGFMFFNEALNLIPIKLSENDSPRVKVLKNIINHTLPEEVRDLEALLNFIDELKIDLNHWIINWNFDKVTIGEAGDITINTTLPDLEHQKQALLDELKLLETRKHLENQIVAKIYIYSRIREVENSLAALQTPPEQITLTRQQGRHIAWLKLVAALKEYHLKRVFAASSQEFNEHSQVIAYLTKKARKIGAHVSEEGNKLLQAQLENLAVDTANYKLELLKSLQQIAPNPKVEKDILWLTAVVKQLKLRKEQIETYDKFKSEALSLYYQFLKLLDKIPWFK
jgi:hypothetical protein